MKPDNYKDRGFALSFSGGKDSTLALYRCIKAGMKPTALITTIDPEGKRSLFHGITPEVLNALASCLGIPVIKAECTSKDYEEKFVQALLQAKEMGAEILAFGDIDLEGHRSWGEARANQVGLLPLYPLWNEGREKLTHEFIDSGFKAYIKLVEMKYLDDTFPGRILDRETVQQIKERGADPCGENGEYHTLVFDGPIFKRPIDIKLGQRGRLSYGEEFNYSYIEVSI